MKNLIKIIILILAAATLHSCKEELSTPVDGDGRAPQAISNPIVTNISGGAVITYDLPDDPNLLYVKAVYERNGKTIESKASYFKNFITVEGLGDTNERTVTLFAVSRAEKSSEPKTVKINPLTPSTVKVAESLNIRESFGGMKIGFENVASTAQLPNNIVIQVMVWDEKESEWKEVDAYYTGLSKGDFSVRGLKSEKRKFGFFVKDTWGNKSAWLEKELTPIYEDELDVKKITYQKDKFLVPQIPPLTKTGTPIVTPTNNGSEPFPNLFDNKIGNTTIFHTSERQPLPAWIPMDLGVKVRLSRYKIWQRMHDNNSTYFYSHGNPHEWEIWGTNTPGDVNSWVLLDHRVMVKPSGLPLGQVSNDDVSTARAGHEYEFDLNVPAVRYLAWKHIDNWASIGGSTGFLHMSEMKFWGQIQ
jgi:hypothetical protein